MSDWDTYGYRVEWTESGPFAGQQFARSVTVETRDEMLAQVREITRRKACTERLAWDPRITEMQRRVETRERVIGLNDWEKNR